MTPDQGPTCAAALADQGHASLAGGDLPAARTRFREALLSDPGHTRALEGLLSVLALESAFGEADAVAARLEGAAPASAVLAAWRVRVRAVPNPLAIYADTKPLAYAVDVRALQSGRIVREADPEGTNHINLCDAGAALVDAAQKAKGWVRLKKLRAADAFDLACWIDGVDGTMSFLRGAGGGGSPHRGKSPSACMLVLEGAPVQTAEFAARWLRCLKTAHHRNVGPGLAGAGTLRSFKAEEAAKTAAWDALEGLRNVLQGEAGGHHPPIVENGTRIG